MSDKSGPFDDEELRSAGWEPGRAIDVDRWRVGLEVDGFVFHDAAIRFLSEFGGLDVRIRGTGVDHAREPFELDPTLCSGDSDRFEDWSNSVGTCFAPVGVVNYGHAFLAIDEDGILYVMADNLLRLNVGIDGLRMLIRGERGSEVSG